MEEAAITQFVFELEKERRQQTLLGKLYGSMERRFFLSSQQEIGICTEFDSSCLSPDKLNIVKEYVNTHLGEEISLHTLADLVCISKYYFSRLFKQATGKSPCQYVNHCRLEEAKRLLQTTRLQMTQIALSVGYKSSSYFSSQFKRYAGVTPSEYRKFF